MKLLLDTHVLIWALADPDLLSATARRALGDPKNEVVVSAVSALEIAVKQSLGKIELPGPAESWLEPVVREVGFGIIPVSFGDAVRVRALPWHHRDPFDRLLVAQALGGFTLCTHDEQLETCGVSVLCASTAEIVATSPGPRGMGRNRADAAAGHELRFWVMSCGEARLRCRVRGASTTHGSRVAARPAGPAARARRPRSGSRRSSRGARV